MRNASKYILLTVGLIAISMAAKAGSSGTRFKAFPSPIQGKLFLIDDLLSNTGIDDLQQRLALSQVLFETGQFTSKSKVATDNNNYSGIMFINKPNVQRNATKGTPFPSSEGKYYYAHFTTPQDWANDFIRILSLNNKPLQATTVEDYVARLGKNKYFVPNTGSALSNYYKGVKHYYDLLTV